MIRKFRRLSMLKKMILLYSIPVMLICVIVLFIEIPSVNRQYEEKEKENVVHICTQAANSLTHYASNMFYLLQMVMENDKICEILGQADFGRHSSEMENYQEFYRLNEQFREIIRFNSVYAIGLYVPDEAFGAVNYEYFYPEEELRERDDYEVLYETVRTGRIYIAELEERKNRYTEEQIKYLAFFRLLRVGKENAESSEYIVKVKVPYETIEEVLINAQTSEADFVYLEDASGNQIAVSDEQRYRELQKQDAILGKELGNWSNVQAGADKYLSYSQNLDEMNCELHIFISEKEFRSRSFAVGRIILVVLLLVCIISLCASVFLSKYYVGRLENLKTKIQNVAQGNISAGLTGTYENGDELDTIFQNFQAMSNRLLQLMKEQYRLGKNVMSAELKILQAQINPHFLYNTLDLINWEAMYAGADEAAEIARNLGQFYRMSLNHGKNAICIRDELTHVKVYVEIENIHYGHMINLKIDMPETILQYACPNIIFQPFVENSIVHGIGENTELESCEIAIRGREENGELFFVIEDDGPGISKEQARRILQTDGVNIDTGYGVKNVDFRIKLCYGEKYGIAFDTSVVRGTKVLIHIPVMSLEELDKIIQ